jgi:hypothetical protein
MNKQTSMGSCCLYFVNSDAFIVNVYVEYTRFLYSHVTYPKLTLEHVVVIPKIVP